MAKKRKRKRKPKFDLGVEVRALARERVGQVKPRRVIPGKRSEKLWEDT